MQASPWSDLPPWFPVHEIVLVGAVAVSVVVVRRLTTVDVDRHLRTRFLLGLPWGTLLVSAFVLCVYLFVQGGLAHPNTPMVIPFRAWSYFYPEGMVLSAFTHANRGHVTSNLIGTITFGAIAEYVWGHYPTGRGVSTFSSLRTNPYARIVAFVIASFVVGILTGTFSLGPAIGFSGVVFAYAGFALTRYPLGTVLAVFVSNAISLVYLSFRNPVITQSGRPQFVTPWFANISIQGHLVGLFVGAVLAAFLVHRRESHPDGLRLWTGVTLFAVSQTLWAVYVPLGSARFKLFRAVGVALTFLLAALIASAVHSTDRPLASLPVVRYRDVALGLTVAILLVTASISVPYNLFTVSNSTDDISPQNSVQVRDYTVAYVEGVPNQYISNVRLPGDRGASNVTASGVVVVSDKREIWWPEVSKAKLAFNRRAVVRVGDVGWRESVVASRTTWKVPGNHSVYTVHLAHGDERILAHTSEPARAEPTIEGRNVTVVPGDPFTLRVTRNGTDLGTVAVPSVNESVTVDNVTFSRKNNRVYAATNATRVRIATYAPRPDRRRT